MSYLLDTNVVSETVKNRPDARVAAWLREHWAGEAYLSVVTIGEIAHGIVRAPSERQGRLQPWFQQLKATFTGRILPLDTESMETWGLLTGEALNRGRALAPLDALVAATALQHSLVLVTRNVEHFAALPVQVLNPWE